MTPAQLALCEKALKYARIGDPIKDAFNDGTLEQETILAAFEFVHEHRDLVLQPRGKR